MRLKLLYASAMGVLITFSLISGQVKTISPDALKTMINDCTIESDYLLLDVRDNSEVRAGIIASDYCKPYHMSLNSGVLEDNYTKLPKEIPIYIYCRSGNRSQQAATFLSSNGFSEVYSMTGGISSYKDSLHDSSEFKTWSITLLDPSFFEGHCPTALNKSPAVRNTPYVNSRYRILTLQGRLVKQPLHRQSGQVFILERIEGENKGKIKGMHRLILER
ncbi:MAG: rhodanese-like domain-containing protein [Chitinispirillaceae bacterium]|nr:rhodanese-like domain-containing protein [Chitinispirillaceae bacterium]